MPELPEVETSRLGISPHLVAKTIDQIIVRQKKLRWLIADNLATLFAQQTIKKIQRRGKYLIFDTDVGSLILHLGMSGSLRIVNKESPAQKHDHVDIVCSDGTCLRYTDPRRFGCLLYTHADPMQHRLLKDLGPEPLSDAFNADYLLQHCANKKVAIKLLIMNSHIVVGVGNIYANEALFKAGIHPAMPAGRLTKTQAKKLVQAIKHILSVAIKKGGTTLKDFTQSDGKPGYFKQTLKVYGRGDEPCTKCKGPLTTIKLGGRQTVFCERCQAKASSNA